MNKLTIGALVAMVLAGYIANKSVGKDEKFYNNTTGRIAFAVAGVSALVFFMGIFQTKKS